ncbi:peptidoglycan-binding domain-containing protein [Knoellia sp. CPCC 206453]|uniref:peptidoglycan-binding domain-containing protein n=1 Tax=Knoellia pratensis TaxID=3404796 RepID=UPI003619BB6C
MAAVAEVLRHLTKQEFLFWAASQIGTTENPRGSNKVPYWLNTKREWNGNAWCAAFLQSGAIVGGKNMTDDFGWGPFYVPQIAADALEAGQWHTSPKVGDWVIMGKTKKSHIGVVEKVIRAGALGSTDLIVQTIEGNTSPTNAGSQNNGDGVYRKKRTGKFVRGFFRPNYAAQDNTAMAPPAPATTRWKRDDVKVMQRLLEIDDDGHWGPDTDVRSSAFRAVAAASVQHSVAQIRIVQAIVDVPVDGSFGPGTRAAVRIAVDDFQRILMVSQDGNWGPGTDRAYVAFHKEWRGQ